MINKKNIKQILRPYIPHVLIKGYHFVVKIFLRFHAFLSYPVNKIRCLVVGRKKMPNVIEKSRPNRRLYSYNNSLLPNRYIENLERESVNIELCRQKTGASIGYPAWNLLYYSLMCSLPGKDEQRAIIVETGTNKGISTIILAQALKDSGIHGCVYTVDIDDKIVAVARENIKKAGLAEYVKFHVQDSLLFLRNLVQEVEYINFAFLDGNHTCDHVRKEFSLIYPKIVARRGKVYFDNTLSGGVADGLHFIKHAYSGNLLEFRNCSWLPPGNVIWQPKW